MTTFKDFNGTETKVGDKVVFVVPRYRELTYGVVSSISAKKAKIKWYSWQYGRSEFQADHGIIIRALEEHQNRDLVGEVQEKRERYLAKILAENAKAATV